MHQQSMTRADTDTNMLPCLGFETEDQKAMIDGLDALCSRHVTEEYLSACDRDSAYPHSVMNHLGNAGWAGLAVEEAFGGSGGSARDLSIVHRTIARHGLAPAQAYFSLWVLGADAIGRLGSEVQREYWLPRLALGSCAVAFALTEPDSGSDAAALRARAVPRADSLIINGQKVFITGAAVADTIITAVRTSAREPGKRGISLVLVDPKAPGVTLRKLPKVGLRSLDLCEVFLNDVEVPLSDVLGPRDLGWESLAAGLALERTFMGSVCVGAMMQILSLCVEHARTRIAFGRPIGAFQLIAAKIVQMRITMEAADLLVARAAAAIDRGDADAPRVAAIAKRYATEAYVSAAREGVQIFGGYGFTEEYPVARHYRDSKFMEIAGGTSEIQTMIVARSMGLG